MLQVSLFGKFGLYWRDKALKGLVPRKAQQLLCYLLIFRHRPHPREVLINNIWVEKTAEKSRKSLRQALWQLQSALESHVESSASNVLLVEPEWIQINPQAALWLDVATFENAFHLIKDTPGKNLTDEAAKTLNIAVKLYKGGLLEGWFDDWCLFERERLQSKYLMMLGKLMAHCKAREKYETGLVYGESVLRLEPAHEQTHRTMMHLYYLDDDRISALRQYERCSAILKKDLGVEPSIRTRELYEQIRAGGPLHRTTASAHISVNSTPQNGMLDEVLDELYRLQSEMEEMQLHIHQKIKAVETALSGGTE